MLNIILAVFDYVFLLNSSLKSTFAQNESCRSSFALQLLFWSNFKFIYRILSFGRSNASQFRSKRTQFFSCAPLCSPDAHTALWPPATSPRVTAPAILALRARRSYPFAGAGCFSSVLFPFLELAGVEPSEAAVARRADRSSPPRPDPSCQSLPHLTPQLRRPISCPFEPLPGQIGVQTAGRHCQPCRSSAPHVDL